VVEEVASTGLQEAPVWCPPHSSDCPGRETATCETGAAAAEAAAALLHCRRLSLAARLAGPCRCLLLLLVLLAAVVVAVGVAPACKLTPGGVAAAGDAPSIRILPPAGSAVLAAAAAAVGDGGPFWWVTSGVSDDTRSQLNCHHCAPSGCASPCTKLTEQPTCIAGASMPGAAELRVSIIHAICPTGQTYASCRRCAIQETPASSIPPTA
jgi:hypothetical protein